MKAYIVLSLAIIIPVALSFKEMRKGYSSGYFLYMPNHSYFTYSNSSSNYYKDADNYSNRNNPLTFLEVYDDPNICDGVTVFVCAVYLNSGSDNYLDDNDLRYASPASMYSVIYRSGAYGSE